MKNTQTFLGEVAIIRDEMPDKDFGAFEKLTNLDSVHDLAREFSQFLELMPYQELGKNVEISLAVYLDPIFAEGRIIAIVARDDYPPDLDSLAKTVQKGIDHLELLRKGIGQRYTSESIDSARHKLMLLVRKIAG